MANVFEQLLESAASRGLSPEGATASSSQALLNSFEEHVQALSQTFENEILLNSLSVHSKAPSCIQPDNLAALTAILTQATQNHNYVLDNEKALLMRTRALHSKLSVPVEPEHQRSFSELVKAIFADGHAMPSELSQNLSWLLTQDQRGATWHEMLHPAVSAVQLMQEYHDKMLARQRLLGRVLTDVL